MSKIEAIIKVPPPRTKKTLRSFLGMVSFYRMFIPNVSSLTSPLTDMLKKIVREPLLWDNNSLGNFDRLKEILSSDLILKLPNVKLPFVLRTDASDYGLGAVLLQYIDDTPFPIAYSSRKLIDRETKYSAIEKECLALLFGVNKFNYYLLGKEFIVEIDHKPLIYLNKFKGKNNRLQRWSLSLQPYRFNLVHIAGQDNVGADFLSRSPV